jgi:hypothetical protein
MTTIGGILIVAGFILGVFGGLTFSRREVMIVDKGNVNKSKQFALTLYIGACAFTMIIGFLCFFGGF